MESTPVEYQYGYFFHPGAYRCKESGVSLNGKSISEKALHVATPKASSHCQISSLSLVLLGTFSASVVVFRTDPHQWAMCLSPVAASVEKTLVRAVSTS